MNREGYKREWCRKNPLYSVHEGMLQRCGLKRGCRSASNLARYRDRGITVCEEWRHFRVFEAWALSHGWRKGLQIDRIDGDGDYCPENCRIVTAKENQRHRVDTRWIQVFGERMSLVEAVERYGGGKRYASVLSRLRMGWDEMRALFTPIDTRFGWKRKTRADS